MFVHIFKYRLKCLLRDRANIFWTMMFPVILATFFYMALSNLGSSEAFKPINLAVVDNEHFRQDLQFKNVLEQVSSGDDRLFNLFIVPEERAKEMLEDNSVEGYIKADTSIDPPIALFVKKSGLNQSIVKSFIDDYLQTQSAVKAILSENPGKYAEILRDLSERKNYLKQVSGTKANPDNLPFFFYTLIAMSCFYGGFFGNREITDIQADISPLAARINAAPVHKMKTFLYSASAALLIHLAELFVLLIYLLLVLKVDFGPKTGYVFLTTMSGSVAGLSFGAFVSAVVKKSEGIKIGILVGTTMFCSFLSGMMNQNMKYIISQNVPVLSWINPVNLLTDAFYCLYYYDTYRRYYLNMAALLFFIVLFCSCTFILIRRRRYASL